MGKDWLLGRNDLNFLASSQIALVTERNTLYGFGGYLRAGVFIEHLMVLNNTLMIKSYAHIYALMENDTNVFIISSDRIMCY